MTLSRSHTYEWKGVRFLLTYFSDMEDTTTKDRLILFSTYLEKNNIIDILTMYRAYVILTFFEIQEFSK